MQEAEIISGQFIKSRKDPPKMLDFVDKTLHQMSLTIEPAIILSAFFGSLMRWNYGLNAVFDHPFNKILGRIPSVCNQVIKSEAFHQSQSLGDVMPMSSCQTQTQRVSQPVHGDMHLGGKATLATSQRLSRLSATFFGRRQHKDEPAQLCCRSSRFPCRDHPQSGATSVPTHPAHTSGRSVCTRYSTCHMRRVTGATAHHCGSSREQLRQSDDKQFHSDRCKHAVRLPKNPLFSTIGDHSASCLP